MNEITSYNQDTKIAGKEDIDVYMAQEWIKNPTAPISSIVLPTMPFPVPFYQTRESLADMDRYKAFIDNCIHRFRKSRTYKSYKAYLMSLGLDRCQINGNIQDGMANIEMHHNFLTIYDITILISQHVLNTVGRCTTFDIVSLLMQEHKNNNIPIVMLSETAHQLYHNDPNFVIKQDQCFGNWPALLFKYRFGITLDIATKVVNYIKNSQMNNELNDLQYFQLSDTVRDWGMANEYFFLHNSGNGIIDWNTGGYIDSNAYECNTISEGNSQDLRNDKGQGRVYSEEELFGPAV